MDVGPLGGHCTCAGTGCTCPAISQQETPAISHRLLSALVLVWVLFVSAILLPIHFVLGTTIHLLATHVKEGILPY